VVLPLPTYPITTINSPDFRLKLTFYIAIFGATSSVFGL